MLLCLSHGNSSPEIDFSLSKQLINSHGTSIYDNTIIALHLAKDYSKKIGVVMNFPMDRGLLMSIQSTHESCDTHLGARKEI